MKKHSNVQTALSKMAQMFSDKKYSDALQLSRKFQTSLKNQAQYHHLVGLCELKIDNYERAIVSFIKSVELAPDNGGFKSNLAISYQKNGQLDKADKLLRSVVLENPTNVQAVCSLGNVLLEKGDIQEAYSQFESADRMVPNSFPILYAMAGALRKLDLDEAAANKFSAALQLKPQDTGLLFEYGKLLQKMGRNHEAIEKYLACLANRQIAVVHRNIAVAYKDIGAIDLAVKHLTLAIDNDHTDLEPFRILSTIKKFSLDDPLVLKMRRLSSNLLSDENQVALHFGFAQYYEDQRNYKEAFHNIKLGNLARRRILPYCLRDEVDFFRRLLAQKKFNISQTLSIKSPDVIPIFVVGMPRSGTSLLEKALSCHSEISGAGELEEIRIFGVTIAQNPCTPDSETIDIFRKKYLNVLKKKSNGCRYVIDKMPQNFRFIPLIKLAFPEAKIVHILRDKYAVCWSNYRTNFGMKGLRYSYDLVDTVKYYKLYEEMMRHWSELDPVSFYSVQYEEMTERPELELRKIVSYLELDWQAAVLQPHKSDLVTTTASQFQVKLPIYTGSSKAWKVYEKFISNVYDNFDKI